MEKIEKTEIKLDNPIQSKKGLLLKRTTDNLLKNYNTRYCILKDKIFSYFNPTNLNKPLGALNFDQCNVEVQEVKN